MAAAARAAAAAAVLLTALAGCGDDGSGAAATSDAKAAAARPPALCGAPPRVRITGRVASPGAVELSGLVLSRTRRREPEQDRAVARVVEAPQHPAAGTGEDEP